MTEEIRAGRNPLRDSGALGLVATPEQLEGLHRIQALMSLLEGHGDVTMDRAGAAAIPSAAHFSEVLRQRRKQTRGPARLLQQLIGIEAKLRQYEEGERFIAAVEDSGGTELLDRAWRGPGVAALAGRDPQPVGMDLPCRHHPRPLRLSRHRAWARRPIPGRRPAGPLHLPPTPGRRWCAGSRAGPTRWPCWSWPWPPAAG